MALTTGTRIGPYEILSALGAGGMGEVYRARDTRLERTVAIKVLPEAFASDAQFRDRFDLEARAISSLNHPHICTLHDVGREQDTAFLVMEYLEGETLAARLERGALPPDQALRHSVEIAGALDAAHRIGIVHRDLKPGNVMLVRGPAGVPSAKLLDLGLAKATAPTLAGSQSMLPTTPRNLTAQGTILGTFQYMSPEQLEGREADARTDIFAFGAVVYEMATGRKAFDGRSQASLVSAIMSADPPPIATFQPLAPAGLDRIVRKCLEKEPERRWQSAADLRDELEWIAKADPAPSTGARAAGWRRLAAPAVMTVGAAAIAAASGVTTWMMTRPAPPPPMRFEVVPPDAAPYSNDLGGVNLAISPDGRYVAYHVWRGTAFQLYLREINALEATPVPGTEGTTEVFFSPDSRWIGFYSIRERKLKKVAVTGGPAVTICDALGANGASWGDDDTIVFAEGGLTGGLYRVSSNGGTPERLTTPNAAGEETDHRRPDILPGSRGVVFSILYGADLRRASVALLDLATREWRVLVVGGSNPRYAASGHIVYGHLGTLMAISLDAQRLEATRNPVPVQEGIVTKNGGVANFGVSETGTLVYAPGGAAAVQGRPVWVGRDGRELAPLIESDLDSPQFPRLSPDGRRLALNVAGDLWVYDLEGRPPSKLTFDGSDFAMMWSPDGQRLVYESASGALFSIPADGSSRTPEKISPDGHFHPHGWSSNGSELVAAEIGTPTLSDLVGLPVGGTGARHAVVQTDNNEGQQGAALSPDSRWLAYVSDVTGQAEVWVRAYPGPGAPVRVSPGGGAEPVWSRNGRELYYLQGDRLMSVAVAPQASFTFAPATQLFEGRFRRRGQPPSYDVAPDGRFLMLKSPATQAITAHFVVVLNWLAELRERVPAN